MEDSSNSFKKITTKAISLEKLPDVLLMITSKKMLLMKKICNSQLMYSKCLDLLKNNEIINLPYDFILKYSFDKIK